MCSPQPLLRKKEHQKFGSRARGRFSYFESWTNRCQNRPRAGDQYPERNFSLRPLCLFALYPLSSDPAVAQWSVCDGWQAPETWEWYNEATIVFLPVRDRKSTFRRGSESGPWIHAGHGESSSASSQTPGRFLDATYRCGQARKQAKW